MGYEATPVLRPPAIIRAFVPAIPQSLWTRSALDWVALIPPAIPTILLSHHMTPLLPGSVWGAYGHLFFGTMAKQYVNVVFDDRDKQQMARPQMVDQQGRALGEAVWLDETTKPPVLKFWTAGVPNVFVTRPQGAKLTPEERAKMAEYDAIVTDEPFAEMIEKAMPELLGKVHCTLNLVIGDLLFKMR